MSQYGTPDNQNPYVQDQSNPYDQPAQQYGAQPMAPYGFAPTLPDHPRATTVLVLGIIAMVAGGITGPFAWYMGSKARKEVRANPGQYKDGGQLLVGWILGIIGTVYLAAMIVFIVIYVVVIIAVIGASAGSY